MPCILLIGLFLKGPITNFITELNFVQSKKNKSNVDADLKINDEE